MNFDSFILNNNAFIIANRLLQQELKIKKGICCVLFNQRNITLYNRVVI